MIRVLYLGHSKKWRGGENQVSLLAMGIKAKYSDVNIHIAYPNKAIMIERIGHSVDGIVRLPSSRPFDPRSVFVLVKYCKRHAIDILHAQSGITHSLALYIKFFIPHIKIIVHRHVDFTIKNRLPTRWKYLSKRINYYIAISSAIKSRLQNYGIPEQKITLIKSSIDNLPYKDLDNQHDKTMLCKRHGFFETHALIGFAGALDRNKDPVSFVRIISQLRQNGLNVNALIAGIGELESEVEREIESLNLTKNIKLVGFIESMPEFFSALDVFVLPSIDEGLGTVLLEAIHANSNVVASNVGGINEIVKDGETGLLVNAGDINAFTNAITMLLLHPSTATQLRINAINHIERNFNSQKMIDENHKIYHQIHRLITNF